jgi:hypothetical protein
MADLVGALRLPEGSFRAEAGTDVIVDILFFRKRQEEETAGDDAWLDLAEIRAATEDEGAIRVNRYFAEHPEMVLGEHALRGGIYGPDETYTCLPRTGADLDEALAAAILHLPESVYDGEPEAVGPDDAEPAIRPERGEHGSSVREGSYFIGANGALMQMVDGTAVTIKIKKGRSADGIFEKHARIIRKLIPIRDAVREILKCQEADPPWKQPLRDFGPINTTVVSSVEDEETGEVRETHRRTNLAPFADDPDCWLVASIEDDDLESNSAKPGAIFTERVIAPPPAPVITSAIDALAVVLNERGAVDLEHVAELLHGDVDAVTVTDRIKRRQHGRSASDKRRRTFVSVACRQPCPSRRNRRAHAQARSAGQRHRRVQIAPFHSGGVVAVAVDSQRDDRASSTRDDRRYARESASYGVPYLGFRGHGTDPQPSLPRCVLRSEPAAVRFKGQSQAIGGRRFDMGRPRPSQA